MDRIRRDFRKHWLVYLMALPVVAFYLIFCYLPMWGALIAFVDFKPRLGLFGSPFVGLKHFVDFVTGLYFWRVVRNTLMLNLWGLAIGFPAPIVLALMLNEVRNRVFKRSIQTLTYLPYFISLVVVCGIIINFTASDGLVNHIVAAFGGKRVALLGEASLFRPIYTLSGVWQGIGWSSIIYLAALASIDPELYEAARMDGAGRFRQMRHVTLPGISSTIGILLILTVGGMMNHGYEKVILLYNPLTYETADIISSYVYRRGLVDFDFSFSTAIGLMTAVLNFILLYSTNRLSRSHSDVGIW